MLAAVTSLAFGLGISFWRAAQENHALQRSNLAAEMALGAAQDEIKSLNERLQRESKAREYAEAGKAVAERAEAMTRDKLAHEAKAHQATEEARVRISARLEAAQADIYAAHQANTEVEASLQTANTQLAQSEETRRNIELAWQFAEYKVSTITAELKEQTEALKAAEAALTNASHRGRQVKTKFGGSAHKKAAPLTPRSAIASQPLPIAGNSRPLHVRKAGQTAETVR